MPECYKDIVLTFHKMFMKRPICSKRRVFKHCNQVDIYFLGLLSLIVA